MKKATFDPAVNLDLYFRKGRDGEKEFRFFDAAGADYELTDEFEIICDFIITLEIEDNILRLIVDGQDVANARAAYSYDIRNITKNKSYFVGTAHFTDTTSAEVEDVTNVTIVLEGEPVEVTINEAGSSAEEHFKGGYDASTDTFPGDADTKAADWWVLTVGGTLDGGNWPIKTVVTALTDNPGQNTDNWRLH